MLGSAIRSTQPTVILKGDVTGYFAVFQSFTSSFSGTLVAFIQRLFKQVKPSFVYEVFFGMFLQKFVVPVEAQTLKKCKMFPFFICLSISGSAPFILGMEESKNLSLSSFKFLGLKLSFNTYTDMV